MCTRLCGCVCVCANVHCTSYQVHISQVFFGFEANCTSCRNAVATLCCSAFFVIQFKTKLRLFTFLFFSMFGAGSFFSCFLLLLAAKIHVCGDVTNICINKKCATDTKTIILMQFTNRKKKRKYF